MNYGVFYKDYLPLIQNIRHIRTISDMNKYIDNITFEELKELNICKNRNRFEDEKSSLKFHLSEYFNDVEFLL